MNDLRAITNSFGLFIINSELVKINEIFSYNLSYQIEIPILADREPKKNGNS